MRVFARPFPIDRLSLEARVLYSGFLVFLLIGLGSSIWLYEDSFGGLGGRSAETYYLGDGALESPVANGSGPALEVPSESAASLRLEKPKRQVMETFHFHLFTVPLVLLVVGHLFMLTSLSVALKVSVIGLATAATLAHLLAPLFIRFANAPGALMPTTVVLSAVGWLPMLIWPLWEMWRPGRPEAEP